MNCNKNSSCSQKDSRTKMQFKVVIWASKDQRFSDVSTRKKWDYYRKTEELKL